MACWSFQVRFHTCALHVFLKPQTLQYGLPCTDPGLPRWQMRSCLLTLVIALLFETLRCFGMLFASNLVVLNLILQCSIDPICPADLTLIASQNAAALCKVCREIYSVAQECSLSPLPPFPPHKNDVDGPREPL